jgi:hypothetical protein
MIYRCCSAKESTLMKDLHGLYVYHPARSAAIAKPDRLVAATRHLSSPGASEIFCVPISTCVDPTCFLHERLQLRRRHLATSDVPQRSRPFADRFDVDIVVTRAANDGSKWISGFMQWKVRELKRMPQKPLGSSPYPVVLNDCEDGIQVPVHRVARTTCLKIIPGTTNPLKPSHEPSFWSFAFSLAKWPA